MSGLRGPEEEDPSHEVGSGGQSRKKGSVKSGRVRTVHKKIWNLGRRSFSSRRSSNSHRWGRATYQAGGQTGRQAGSSDARNRSRSGHRNGVRAVVRRRRVRLLHRQARVIAGSVEAGRLAGVDRVSAVEVLFVDAVAKRVRNSSEDRSPDLAGGHFSEFDDGGFWVEGRVRRHDEVGRVFERRRRRHQVVRLALVDVESGCADAVVLQGRGQGCLVDEATSSCVDQKCTWKQGRQLNLGILLRISQFKSETANLP